MEASFIDEKYILEIYIESGHMNFETTIEIQEKDFEVLKSDLERASLLHAAIHHPFQLKETALSKEEQRMYLDIILHGQNQEVENFLTKQDHGDANGAISNMLRITCKRDQNSLREGRWFKEKTGKR